jgi:hypothetical protein
LIYFKKLKFGGPYTVSGRDFWQFLGIKIKCRSDLTSAEFCAFHAENSMHRFLVVISYRDPGSGIKFSRIRDSG